MSANHKPKFKKGQIKTMGDEQCIDELRLLNLDISGNLGQKRDRLREALYPNPNLNASTQVLSQQASTSQVQLAATITAQGEGTDQWFLIRKTSGPVYTRIPKGTLQ